MASTEAIPSTLTSYVYEDLVAHIQTIQKQIIKISEYISEHQKDLKSRSLTIIDPFGNATDRIFLDHELLGIILKKYKKDYVPKYLQQWIQFGIDTNTKIIPLTDCQMKSNVSEWDDDSEFICLGKISVWMGYYESAPAFHMEIPVRLLYDMNKLKSVIKGQRTCVNIELKSLIIESNIRPNSDHWNQGIALNEEDTVMSAKLYEKNCILMAKIIPEVCISKVKNNSSVFFFLSIVSFK